ncbi:tyrosine-type recombinase/integrase [Robiginitomaculum antarcticum]|uniref:hypothetical protein n=1 Tax=Robiginitomaculum antarcticum TaxID=437507 RepID=UPI00037244FE
MLVLYERFDESHISVRLKSNSAADYRLIFKKHILPRFKHITVGKIKKQDLLRMHHDMRD